MGLKPWNKIAIHIYEDNFDIVADNVEYIRKRLECDVIPNSQYKTSNSNRNINMKCYQVEEESQETQSDKQENNKDKEQQEKEQENNNNKTKKIVYAVVLL